MGKSNSGQTQSFVACLLCAVYGESVLTPMAELNGLLRRVSGQQSLEDALSGLLRTKSVDP